METSSCVAFELCSMLIERMNGTCTEPFASNADRLIFSWIFIYHSILFVECRWIWLDGAHFISFIGHFIEQTYRRNRALQWQNVFNSCIFFSLSLSWWLTETKTQMCWNSAKISYKKLMKFVEHLFQCCEIVDVEMLRYYLNAAKQNIRNQSRAP